MTAAPEQFGPSDPSRRRVAVRESIQARRSRRAPRSRAMDFTGLKMLGVNVEKGNGILCRRHRMLLEVLISPNSAGRRASFRQGVIRLACDLWGVRALPQDSEKRVAKVLELMVGAMFLDQDLPRIDWSVLAREALAEAEQEKEDREARKARDKAEEKKRDPGRDADEESREHSKKKAKKEKKKEEKKEKNKDKHKDRDKSEKRQTDDEKRGEKGRHRDGDSTKSGSPRRTISRTQADRGSSSAAPPVATQIRMDAETARHMQVAENASGAEHKSSRPNAANSVPSTPQSQPGLASQDAGIETLQNSKTDGMIRHRSREHEQERVTPRPRRSPRRDERERSGKNWCERRKRRSSSNDSGSRARQIRQHSMSSERRTEQDRSAHLRARYMRVRGGEEAPNQRRRSRSPTSAAGPQAKGPGILAAPIRPMPVQSYPPKVVQSKPRYFDDFEEQRRRWPPLSVLQVVQAQAAPGWSAPRGQYATEFEFACPIQAHEDMLYIWWRQMAHAKLIPDILYYGTSAQYNCYAYGGSESQPCVRTIAGPSISWFITGDGGLRVAGEVAECAKIKKTASPSFPRICTGEHCPRTFHRKATKNTETRQSENLGLTSGGLDVRKEWTSPRIV